MPETGEASVPVVSGDNIHLESSCELGKFSQKAIQLIGKLQFVMLTERSLISAHLDTAGSHCIEKVVHIEAFTNIFLCKHLAAWTYGITTFFDDSGSQWNIVCDY